MQAVTAPIKYGFVKCRSMVSPVGISIDGTIMAESTAGGTYPSARSKSGGNRNRPEMGNMMYRIPKVTIAIPAIIRISSV